MSPTEKKVMINRNHPDLSINHQCKLVKLSRSAFYYAPVGIDDETLAVMTAIDKAFTRYPFFGSRQIAAYLRRNGIAVGRHRVRRLMRILGLEAIYTRPRTSQPHPAHPVYPYLLKGMTIDRPNQVWCADITFVPVRHGFLYLVAIMDWATRKVLSWRLLHTRRGPIAWRSEQCAEGAVGDLDGWRSRPSLQARLAHRLPRPVRHHRRCMVDHDVAGRCPRTTRKPTRQDGEWCSFFHQTR